MLLEQRTTICERVSATIQRYVMYNKLKSDRIAYISVFLWWQETQPNTGILINIRFLSHKAHIRFQRYRPFKHVLSYFNASEWIML